MKQPPVKVFLDANIIIQTGKPPGGPLFDRVVDLVEAGFIHVITTDLTKSEVAKKHAENDFNVIKEVGRAHFRKLVEAVLGVKLPNVEKTDIKETLLRKYTKEVEAMSDALKAKTLSIDTVVPSVVFNAYAAEKGFFSGEGKRNQFPDAFIFECIKKEASENTPVTVVSQDGDFDGPSAGEKFISAVKSIPDLFKMLDLGFDSPDVGAFLAEQKEHVREIVDSEINDWGLNVRDIEDAEIDKVKVTNVELMNLKTFGRVTKDGDVLVIGAMQIVAMVSYTHPDWDNAMYDSEDKILIPFEDVSGEREIALEAEFSMSILVDEDGKLEAIDQFGFTNDEFAWVDLRADDWMDY